MNGLEEIQKIIKNFVYESKQAKEQIAEIENRRTQLAQERNEKKNANTSNCWAEVDALGKQISELGNQSQELQNKLDSRFNEIRKLVNLTIDNLITEGIRKVRKIDEEKQELEEKILLQKERNTKYEMQKQEFYNRFGRMPELSENSKKEDEVQDKQCLSYKTRIEEVEELIGNMEVELAQLASIKRDFKNKNWSSIVGSEKEEETENIVQNVEEIEEEAIVLPLMEEEIKVEEIEPIEYIKVEDFEPIEEIKIEELEVAPFEIAKEIEEETTEKDEPIEEIEIQELDIEPFEMVEEFEEQEPVENIEQVEKIEPVTEQKQVDEIEELAKAIVEEIIAEQTKDLNINKVEEKQEESVEQEIITFEEKEENIKTQLAEETVTLSNIIAKIEDGEVVYKAQASNGEELKVYPTLETRNVLLNDKESREEIKEILINYAVAEYKILDNKVINKIDPTVCEVLEKFAQKYNYDARNLIYNYAMSFSRKEETEIEVAIPITYNFSYLGGTNLSKKEKTTISKICKNALKNEKIDIIGGVTGFSRIKYIFKRLFATNNANALPEGKY